MSKPVFIVGMPRSGTTLLSNILNATGEIYFPEETHYFDSYKKFRDNNGADSAFSDYYLSKKNFYLKFLNLEMNELEALKSFKEKADVKAFFIELMVVKTKGKGTSNWGEKTPIHALYLDTILSFFPEARIIHISRDPRDVINSIKKSSWERLFPFYRRLQEYKTVAGLAGNSVDNRQIMHVRFEDFLNRPEENLRSVCEFCGLSYSDRIVNNFHKDANTNFDLEKEPWKKNNMNPLDASRAFSWQKEADTFLNRFISWYLKKSIASLGYRTGVPPGLFSRNLYLLYICFTHMIRKAKESL